MALDVTSSSLDNQFFQLNGTLEEHLTSLRGPRHLPMSIVIPLTVLCVSEFFSGVIGNFLVCVVIYKNTNMHSNTNYYLFSLAISDIILLVFGLPNDLSLYWQQYPWMFGNIMCKLRAFISETTSYASVWTIVAFSMERYLAICHPLSSLARGNTKRVIRSIFSIWGMSFFSGLPFAFYTNVSYINYPPESDNRIDETAFCAMLIEDIPEYFPIYELSFLLFLVIPLIIISIVYWKISRLLGNVRLNMGIIHGDKQNRAAIVRMLFGVVVMFFVCWAPFHIQRLFYIHGKDLTHFLTVNEYMYYISGCLYYLSATLNPFLYNAMSEKYRNAFRKTLGLKKILPAKNKKLNETSKLKRQSYADSTECEAHEFCTLTNNNGNINNLQETHFDKRTDNVDGFLPQFSMAVTKF